LAVGVSGLQKAEVSGSTTQGKAAFEVHHKLNANIKQLQSTQNLNSVGMECNWNMSLSLERISIASSHSSLQEEISLLYPLTSATTPCMHACTEQDFGNDRTQLVACTYSACIHYRDKLHNSIENWNYTVIMVQCSCIVQIQCIVVYYV